MSLGEFDVIPKILHFVWVGDESRRPDACIDTWRQLNPDYEVKVWGNEQWHSGGWRTAHQMEAIGARGLAGVADLMRYEILVREGGVTLDADSVCTRPLPDWLLDTSEFAVWESEIMRPGLVANGYLGAVPGSPFFDGIVERFASAPLMTDRDPWNTTGPVAFTEYMHDRGEEITVYPSHYFIPRHYTGFQYTGAGPVFAAQLWGTTEIDYGSADEFVRMAQADDLQRASMDPAAQVASLGAQPWADYHGPGEPSWLSRAVDKALRVLRLRPEETERRKVGARAVTHAKA